TVAGDGTCCYVSGDGIPATQAQFWGPMGVAVGSAGNLFFADSNNYPIRKVLTDGVIPTFSCTGTGGFSGDGGPVAKAWLNYPTGVAVDGAGNVFVSDTGNFRIRKISADGVISTVAGNGAFGLSGDGGPATAATLRWASGIAIDAVGNL